MKQFIHSFKHKGFLLLPFLFGFWAPSVLEAQVSGTVFRDFNANGTKDAVASPSYTEVGIAGIVVKAYNPSGTLLTTAYTGGGTSTNSTGAYTVTGGTLGQIRLEFVLPNGFVFASKGSTGGTTVMFPTTATQNLGVNYPDDYWDNTKDPRYVVPCYVNGTAAAGGADAAIVSTPYRASTGLNSAYKNNNGVTGTGVKPRLDAIASQVGTVWGEAYYKTQKHYYFSTFLKRHSGMADGPGYIYNFDYSGATPTLTGKFNLQGATPVNGGAAIDLGTVTRTGSADYVLPSNKANPSIDLDAFGKVGTMSFGDIDMQPNTGFLWAVNLFQKALIRIDVSGNPATLPTGIEQYILSGLPGYPTTTTGVLRPWALAFNDGKGYLGVVNDASTGTDANLNAYVLQFDPNNIAAGFTSVLTFSPNAKRLSGDYFSFHKWENAWSAAKFNHSSVYYYAMPLLSDINFDANGNMYLALMDRFGHQCGAYNYPAISGTSTLMTSANGYGDILIACATATGWSIEGVGGCKTGAEFFQDIPGDQDEESSEGATALLKGSNQILVVTKDPHPQVFSAPDPYYDTQGLHTYNLTTGAIDNWYGVNYGDRPPLFSKANGLGDVEFIVDPAPLEVGNRVWTDTNSNGLQDAGEAGIDGLTVLLFEGATQVGTTTTASGGQYYFTAANVTGGLKYNTAYEIRIATAQTPLSTLSLTTTDVGTNASDLIDNDGSLSGANAIKAFTTGTAGENNHSYDFGFSAAPLCTSPTLTSVATDTATCTNGVANNNAKVAVRGIVGMTKYAYSTNGTTGLFALNATASTIDSIKLTGLANPATATTYTFRIYAADTTCFNDTTVILNPSVCSAPCPHIVMTPNPLSDGRVNEPYSVQIVATGGVPPYQFVWLAGLSGSLPAGLSMSSTGLVSGTPTTTGSYAIKIKVIDGHQCPDSLDPDILMVLPACTVPTGISLTQTAPTCTGATANNNGKITLSAFTNGTHYGISTLGAATYDGATYATATAITGTPDVKTAIPNTGGAYIVRIFNGSNTCYIDQTVTVAAVTCTSPPSGCTGNIFINGSMETTNGKPFNTTYQGSTASTGSSLGSSNAFPDAGWSDSNSGGYYVTGANAQDGTKFFYFPSVDKCLNGNAAIASACKAYKVTFYAAAFTASGAQQASDFTFHYKFYTGATYNSANVIGDEDDYKFTAPASTGWSNLNWQKYTAIVVSPPTSEGVRLKFTAASSSSGVAFDNICVTEALPSDFIVSSNPACGGSLQLMASSIMDYQPSTSPALVKFNWSGPNGFTSTAQKPVVGTMTAALAGTYSVTITSGPSGNTCQQIGSLTIANPCVATCTAPSGITLTQAAPTCTGATANNNGKITLSASTNGTHYGVSTLGAATYDGAAFATATAITGTPDVKTAILNTGGAYIVRIFNGSDACYTDQTVTVAAVTCAASCTTPTGGTVTSTQATCTGATANSDASISITGLVGGDKYAYNTSGGTGLAYAGATTFAGGTITLAGLPNPSVSTTYTIRVFNLANDCYMDLTATIAPKTCTALCPNPACIQVTVARN
jgi:SdrD B-like domain